MKDLKEFIEVKIDNPIKTHLNIDGKNDIVELDTIYLKCFNKKDHQNVTLLMRNKYKRMMLDNMSFFSKLIGKDNGQNKDKEISEEEQIDSIIETFSICDGEELLSFYDKFKEFLIKDIAFKDESFSQKLQMNDLLKLDNDDLEKIIASYIGVFFIIFWMK